VATISGRFLIQAVLAGLVVLAAACGGSGGGDARDALADAGDADPGAESGPDAADDGTPADGMDAADVVPEAVEDAHPGDVPGACDTYPAGPFDPDAFDPVRGWILLDRDPAAVRAALEAAPRFGINHVQLSEDLLMDIDELLDDTPETLARVAGLNEAIALAHDKGIRVYVWCHELPTGAIAVCYGPDGDLWRQRAEAYRKGIARIPDVDGVILMFGSAGTPPWLSFCDCDWCPDTYGESLDSPPQAERLRLIVQNVAAVVTGELGKEVIGRVFIHEAEENAWHQEGLAAATCTPFVTMHKDAVNDWQPYNPPDPTMPVAPGRPAFMETDAAGEYFGQSELPFAAPGYYRYRLAYAREHQGIGYAARIERGSNRALGTPNEVNLWALTRLLEDPRTPLAAIWDQALQSLYGVAPGSESSLTLRSVLETSFPIRVKSHYALGIWALDKGSDIPSQPEFGQLFQRGDMRKWDPDWTATWEALDHPDRGTVLRIHQEGTEAVVLAGEARATFLDRRPALESAGMRAADLDDLDRRLRHQAHAATAWRAVDLFLWASRARGQGVVDPDLAAFMAHAVQELRDTADAMDAEGLSDVDFAGPGRLRGFADAAVKGVPEGTVGLAPPEPLFSPLRVVSVGPDRVTLRFRTSRAAQVTLDLGLEMPGYGRTVAVGAVAAGEDRDVAVDGLEAGQRYVARLRAPTGEGPEATGGETWIFTTFPPVP
jgi:hypothetical protein